MNLFQEINEAAVRIPRVVTDNKVALIAAIKSATSLADTKNNVMDIIDKHYADEIWSVDKDEWKKMNHTQRDSFVRAVIDHVAKKQK